MRRLVFVAVGVGLLSSGFAAGASVGASPPGVRLVVPGPGHVTLAALKVRVIAPAGAKLPTRVSFRLPASSGVPRRAVALTAVKALRAGRSATYTILLALLNPSGGALRATQSVSEGPRGLIDPFACEERAISGRSVLSFRFATPQYLPGGFIDFSNVFGQSSRSGSVLCSWTRAANADLGTRAQRARAASAAARVLSVPPKATLSALLDDASLSTGIYNASHPLGFQFNTPLSREAERDSWSLLTTPQQNLDHVIQKLHAELTAGGALPPPPRPKLYKFAFGPLGLSFDYTVPNSTPAFVEHWVVSIQGGTACGTDLLTAAWEISWTLSGVGSPQQRSGLYSFQGANPLNFYNFRDNTSNNLTMNLRIATGSSPAVQVEQTVTGSNIANVIVNPRQAAITATPVASTC